MRVQIHTDKAKFTVELDAEQDFLSCLMTAVIAALPCFLESFMKCLAGGNGPSTGFKPGDRTRCD